MTNTELNRWLAEHVVGWRWVSDLAFHEGGYWVERDGTARFDFPNGFKPTTRPDHTALVMERMRVLGFHYDGHSLEYPDGTIIHCWRFHRRPRRLEPSWSEDDTEERAKCLAAKTAMEVEEG